MSAFKADDVRLLDVAARTMEVAAVNALRALTVRRMFDQRISA